MALPDFELGPLEMLEVAASEPAIAPASARAKVGKDEFLLRLCRNRSHWPEPRFFFRLDIPDAPVVANRSTSSAECLAALLQLQCSNLSSWFREYLKEGNFERNLPFRSLDENKPCRLSIGAEVHHWRATVSSGGNTSFQMPCPRLQDFSHLVMHEVDSVIVDEVERSLANCESDCFFAWRWMQMNSDEQQKVISQFKRGEYDEFIQVMKWVTYENISFNAQSSVEWMIDLTLRWDQVSSASLIQSNKYQFLGYSNSVYREKINSLLSVVEFYFSPGHDVSLERYSVIKHCSLVSHFEIYLCFSAPTHHERLEARLRLREWLADKVAPNEIPALLGEQ